MVVVPDEVWPVVELEMVWLPPVELVVLVGDDLVEEAVVVSVDEVVVAVGVASLDDVPVDCVPELAGSDEVEKNS